MPTEWLDPARAARTQFLARTCVRYVVVDKQRASPELRAVAVDVLGLVSVHEDDHYELLSPMDPPKCELRPRRPRAFDWAGLSVP